LAGESKIGFELYPTVKARAIFFWTLFRRSRLFPLAITLTSYGFHFRRLPSVC